MYVRATIEEGIAPNSFLVPQRAVTRDAKGQPLALFVSSDGKVQRRTLSVQRSVGNSWLVAEGITDGDRVIVEGLQRVRDGQDVKVDDVVVDDATGQINQAADTSAAPVKEAANTPVSK